MMFYTATVTQAGTVLGHLYFPHGTEPWPTITVSTSEPLGSPTIGTVQATTLQHITMTLWSKGEADTIVYELKLPEDVDPALLDKVRGFTRA